MKDFDIYNKVTNRIIEQLEKGVIPWEKPWKVSASFIKGAEDLRKLAFNRVTKSAYSLINQMILSKPGEYASFKQWTERGGKIKKGAKAEMVVFWKWLKYEDKQNVDEDGNPKIKDIPYLRYLQVFHISDVEGVEPLKLDNKEEQTEEPISPTFDPVEEAENTITAYSERENISISFGGDSAYYSPSSDSIQLPERFSFQKNGAEFYSTAFHEITHSTGASHRLARGFSGSFGSNAYSREELVAEIGASAMLNILNIETTRSFKNSVAYIQSWIKALKNDNKLIVTASARAEKAIDYIFNGKDVSEAA